MARRADRAAPPVALAIVADATAALRAAGLLFPGVERFALSRDELRPRAPFRGPLFERLATVPAGACVALVVPVVWRGPAGEAGPAAPGDRAAGSAARAPAPLFCQSPIT